KLERAPPPLSTSPTTSRESRRGWPPPLVRPRRKGASRNHCASSFIPPRVGSGASAVERSSSARRSLVGRGAGLRRLLGRATHGWVADAVVPRWCARPGRVEVTHRPAPGSRGGGDQPDTQEEADPREDPV